MLPRPSSAGRVATSHVCGHPFVPHPQPLVWPLLLILRPLSDTLVMEEKCFYLQVKLHFSQETTVCTTLYFMGIVLLNKEATRGTMMALICKTDD